MITAELIVLLLTTVSIAFFHTLLGPDHYLPFIVMQKAGKWTTTKTVWVTVLSGIGHVISSVAIGLVGVLFGISLNNIEFFESFRGNLAAWMFVAFGLGYLVWGIRKAIKNKPHTHFHTHADGSVHIHKHTHFEEHSHVHSNQLMQAIPDFKSAQNLRPATKAPTETIPEKLTPWVLFTIFLFGPCEPLIPIVMYPAAKGNYGEMMITTLVFTVITVATMLGIVLFSVYGINRIPLKKAERYSHALAGATIMCSGLAIIFLGW